MKSSQKIRQMILRLVKFSLWLTGNETTPLEITLTTTTNHQQTQSNYNDRTTTKYQQRHKQQQKHRINNKSKNI